MKNLQFLKMALLSILLAGAIACEEFTETDLPQSQLTQPAVYSDAATATAALSDIYARVRESGLLSGDSQGWAVMAGNYADELQWYGGEGTTASDFYNHAVLASNSGISAWWNTTYSEIYAINSLLQGIENSDAIVGTQRDRLVGEGLFLRSLLHLYLVNIFGDVPYIKSTDYRINSAVSRTPKSQVYDELVADLLEAKALLPEDYPSSERVRANKGAATALLARVYLYMEDWQRASDQASLVINNNLYQWVEDPAMVFLKDSPSVILEWHPGTQGNNTIDAGNYIFDSAPPPSVALSPQLISAFESGDLRKEVWTESVTDGANTYHYAYKYKVNSLTAPPTEYSIVLRLAEQYLIRSEARTQLGDIAGAQQDLNKVRNRAGLADTTLSTASGLLDAIIRERRVELFTEMGHRWFDLKRNGQAGNFLAPIKPFWNEAHLLFPIPENELLLNPNLNPQNPGY